MPAAKTRKSKIQEKPNKIKTVGDTLENKSWEQVKIKGNVISDDGGGFEGLIGLEVLEDYDPKMVETAKERRTRKEKRMDRKVESKKRKLEKTADDKGSEKENSDSEIEASVKPENRKKRLAERKLKLLQKRKEKREKRKQKRSATKVSKDDQPSQKDSLANEEYPPDRFALLRPPAFENSGADENLEDDETEAPQIVNESALSIDDLEGWNGLGVPQPVLRAISEKGFKSPTEIQAMTLPAAILGKKDILGAAETGSGKTLAFGIPILAGIMELKSKNVRSGIRKAPKVKGQKSEINAKQVEEDRELTPPPEELHFYPTLPTEDEASESDEDMEENGPLYAVVLTPTRELAVQVRDHLVAAAKYTGIKVAAIFGGLAVAKQERLLKQCPEIVVATPGRLWELYEQENPHLSKMEDISFLVIDETDRMVEKGHFEELRSLLKVLNANEEKKQTRQNFVFSATLTLVHDLPDHMQRRNVGKRKKFIKQTPGLKIQSLIEELGISQPKIVDITRSQQTAQTLTECRLICPIDQKDYYLYYFVQRHPGRTIVFCNSIDCVKRLATLFGLLECAPLPLHASMVQKQRLKNLERFRDNPNGLLIATDVAARGLDIPNVEHVIHYQVPRTSENYVHRSGRTARANKNGITVMFMEPGEVKNYVKLYKTLDRTEDLPLFPVSEKYLRAVKERVNLAREVDKQELKLRRTQSEIGWMKKQAEEMDMIIDGFNDESGSDQDDEDAFVVEKRRDRLHLENVRAQLRALLCKPMFPKGFSFKYPTSSGQLQMPDIGASGTASDKGSAVNVMKAAIDDLKQAKKDRIKKRKLFA
ncbi:PREDICTED: ATP-dependent RNA helicase DDX24 [Rhagoletis zephyria]|uniref:ATP-dependent RNA helicase DDX24 n=1 Tax=Rhagoletis zephyria TaxID=28612 RepID=UPI0008119DC1|nr:PREDICTED: ATP-dependent RNA helicase DDX24 [Rhagoletis zephyria]